ncbi:MAG: hypothetical protein OSB62_08430 [Alphaproteobacteria bacterium]|nr:hypothetical protein [Alphaproteobacteria bacterium]
MENFISNLIYNRTYQALTALGAIGIAALTYTGNFSPAWLGYILALCSTLSVFTIERGIRRKKAEE